jgi:regulator of extracellular matrix RemA (YlzA/DUF370 family)
LCCHLEIPNGIAASVPASFSKGLPNRVAVTETNDPNHLRDRAAQMRALALTMKDSEVVTLMAADYDKLADRMAVKKSPLRR